MTGQILDDQTRPATASSFIQSCLYREEPVDWDDRRKYPRYDLSRSITMSHPSGRKDKGVTLNISRGGLAVRPLSISEDGLPPWAPEEEVIVTGLVSIPLTYAVVCYNDDLLRLRCTCDGEALRSVDALLDFVSGNTCPPRELQTNARRLRRGVVAALVIVPCLIIAGGLAIATGLFMGSEPASARSMQPESAAASSQTSRAREETKRSAAATPDDPDAPKPTLFNIPAGTRFDVTIDRSNPGLRSAELVGEFRDPQRPSVVMMPRGTKLTGRPAAEDERTTVWTDVTLPGERPVSLLRNASNDPSSGQLIAPMFTPIGSSMIVVRQDMVLPRFRPLN